MGRSWLRTHFDPHAAVGVYFVVLTLLMCWTAVHMSFGSKVDPWMTKVLGGKEAEMVRPVASRESASFKWHTGPTNLFASSSSNRKTVRQVVAVSRSLIRSPASCVVSKTAVASREDRGSISTSMLFTPVRSVAGHCDLPTPWRASLFQYNPSPALHSGYCAGKKRSPTPIRRREANRLAEQMRRTVDGVQLT